MIFIDTNIMIDLLEPSTTWHAWSARHIALAADAVSNVIVLAETAGRFGDVEAARIVFRMLDITILPLTDESGFLAGQTFLRYRRKAEKRDKLLADFLIGAHAMVMGADLMTRDPKLYRTYFPELTLITPEDDHG